ncbi:MAG: FMN-binding protein, partial [Eubacteriales bacterium]|nr:FMN-binding protein [Eubacteriales bacterium]
RVTMDGDKIANVEVVAQNETEGIGDKAIEAIPAAIVAANSADVDVVASATVTSKAIIAAVKDALSQVK